MKRLGQDIDVQNKTTVRRSRTTDNIVAIAQSIGPSFFGFDHSTNVITPYFAEKIIRS